MPTWVAIIVVLAVVLSRVSWFLEKWRGKR
jgi:hypothetical protein